MQRSQNQKKKASGAIKNITRERRKSEEQSRRNIYKVLQFFSLESRYFFPILSTQMNGTVIKINDNGTESIKITVDYGMRRT